VRYDSHGSSFLDSAWYAQLQKDTNVKVNWDVRWNADFTEQKALMFASGAIQANARDFITIEPPAAPNGTRYALWMGEMVRQQEFMITTKCKNPEVVARWADQFYTTDATIQNTWGAFGETTRKVLQSSLQGKQTVQRRSVLSCLMRLLS
jgi:hypothetical protein